MRVEKIDDKMLCVNDIQDNNAFSVIFDDNDIRLTSGAISQGTLKSIVISDALKNNTLKQHTMSTDKMFMIFDNTIDFL